MLTFVSRAAAIAATIASTESAIYLLGYTTVGIGASWYAKLSSTPSPVKAWHFQSADGAWWELKADIANENMFGADPTGSADSTSAIQALMDYVSQKTATFISAAGTFIITSTISSLPGIVTGSGADHRYRGPTWRFSNNTTYVATAPFTGTAMFKFGLDDSNYEHLIADGLIEGGVFDCNGVAQFGPWISWCNKCVVRSTQVRNMAAGSPTGIKFGSNAGITSYEGFAEDNRIIGNFATGTALANSVAIRFENCTDNQTRDNSGTGVLVGIGGDSISGWDGKHSNNHFWNFSQNGAMNYCYDLYGDNLIEGAQCDGPFLYACRFQGQRNHVVGMKVNYGLNSADADNVAALFRLEGSGEVTVTNSGFKGQPSKRIAAEASFGSGVLTSAFKKDNSNRYTNVIALQPANLGIAARAHVTVASGVPTTKTSDNVTSITRYAAGDYRITLTNAVDANTPVVVTASASGGGALLSGQEVKQNRTTTYIRAVFYNSANALTDPDAFSIIAGGIG